MYVINGENAFLKPHDTRLRAVIMSDVEEEEEDVSTFQDTLRKCTETSGHKTIGADRRGKKKIESATKRLCINTHHLSRCDCRCRCCCRNYYFSLMLRYDRGAVSGSTRLA